MGRHEDISAPQNLGIADWDAAGDEFALVQSRINTGDIRLRERLLSLEARKRTLEQAAGEEWTGSNR